MDKELGKDWWGWKVLAFVYKTERDGKHDRGVLPREIYENCWQYISSWHREHGGWLRVLLDKKYLAFTGGERMLTRVRITQRGIRELQRRGLLPKL